jgi:hypothetical protein
MADQFLPPLGAEFQPENEEQIILDWVTITYLTAELRSVLKHNRFTHRFKLNWYREFWTILKLLESCRRPGSDGPDDLGDEVVITKRQAKNQQRTENVANID